MGALPGTSGSPGGPTTPTPRNCGDALGHTSKSSTETKQGDSEVTNCGQREAVHQVASGDRKSAGDTPRQGSCARVVLSLPATPQDPGGQDTASAGSGQPPRLPSSSHARVTPHTGSNFPQATAEMDLAVAGRSDITQKF